MKKKQSRKTNLNKQTISQFHSSKIKGGTLTTKPPTHHCNGLPTDGCNGITVACGD